MPHKPKAVGLLLFAVFVMSAAVAPSASMADEFVVEGEKKVTVTGEQISGQVTGIETTKHEFKTAAGTVKCTPTTFDGVLEGSSGDLTLAPTYGNTAAGTGCTLAGIAGTIVHMRSCDYLLTAGETVEGSENKIGVVPHIKCTTGGDKIEITSGSCTITIPEQSFAESMVTAENSGGAGTAMDLKLVIDITGITYEVHGTCPNAPTVTTPTSDGFYKGVATLKADEFVNNANKVGLTVGVAPPPPTSEFVVEGEKKVTVTGEQISGQVTGIETTKHEFKTAAGTVKCTPTTFDGVLEGSSGDLTLAPTYGNTAAGTGCTLAGIAGTIVHMRSCDYLLTAGETVEGSENKIGVVPHIKCTTGGDKIEITSGSCTITIPEQSFAESMVTAENSGGAGTAMDLKLVIDITGITYEVHGTCPNAPTVTTPTSDGFYKGVATLKADEFVNNANKVGLTVGVAPPPPTSEFVVEGEKKVTVTGEQISGQVTGIETTKHEFKTAAGTVKCTPTTFDGVLEGSSGDLTLAPTYGNTAAGTGCTLAGIAGTIVHMRSCDYLLTAGETVEGSENKIGVVPHIKCTTGGDKIEITSGSCTITIPEQSFAESMVTAENSGGAGTAMDLKLVIDITGITYEVHGTCPNAPTVTTPTSDGFYKGVATLKADEFVNNANKVGLTVK